MSARFKMPQERHAHGARDLDESHDELIRPSESPAAHFMITPPGVAADPVRRARRGEDVLGGTAVPADTLAILARRRGGGQPLPEHLAMPMGAQLGVNLSAVRVHVDAEAQAVSRSLQATAFTHGGDIYFDRGAYDPGSANGQRVLAHELAHVAQQAGRSGTGSRPMVGRADDPAEADADRVAADVLRRWGNTAAAPSDVPTTALQNVHTGPLDRLRRQSRRVQQQPVDPAPPATPVSAPMGPIRRKVGFELELKLDLAKGRVITAPAKKKKPKEQFLTLGGRGTRALEETEPLIAAHTPETREKLEKSKVQNITKGETIRSGTGWRLTPDGGAGNWYPEFITDPVDEDKQPAQPAQIMRALASTVMKEWGGLVPGRYIGQGNDFVVGVPKRARPPDLAANIHFTIGVRPERVIDLLEMLARASGGKSGVRKGKELEGEIERRDSTISIDPSTTGILRSAVAAGKKVPGDQVYRGLVALMGSYVGGELRIVTEMLSAVGDLKLSMREENERLDNCVDQTDLSEFIRTGAVTDQESLRCASREYSSQDEFVKDLRGFLNSRAPAAAKLNVPVLSRSSLAELRERTTIVSYPHFVNHVLAAAGLDPGQANLRLFPFGVTNPKKSRTIEARPDITIGQWVKSVFDGKNLTFTDETKSFEDVGPVLGSCLCFFETRAKGAVIEIRALDESRKVPPELWVTLANEVVAMLATLNSDD